MRWKDGKLYLGRIWVGSVRREVPENWRDDAYFRQSYQRSSGLFAKIQEDARKRYEKKEATPWSVWLSSDEDNGHDLGNYATEEDARGALEAVVREALAGK